jgi:hypothetical protein
MWVGLTDEGHEGNFTNVNTGEMLDKQVGNDLFDVNQPNGGEKQNCVRAIFKYKAWFDDKCKEKFCSFCLLNSYPIFKVRGEPILTSCILQIINVVLIMLFRVHLQGLSS